MSNSIFLDIQYSFSKRRCLQKPSHIFSSRDRQSSGMLPIFLPNLEEMRQVFDKFDSNKDGKISPTEYKAILRAMGECHTAKDVEKIFEVADLDGDGYIDFEEFVEVQKKEGGVGKLDIDNAFRTFDLDGDGRINIDEVFEVLRRLGESCNLQDCQRMVRAVDSNGDGSIDKDEFMMMMTTTPMKLK